MSNWKTTTYIPDQHIYAGVTMTMQETLCKKDFVSQENLFANIFKPKCQKCRLIESALETSRAVKKYTRDLEKTLLTMNEKKIRAFLEKHGQGSPADTYAFWLTVHKTRSAIKPSPSFPLIEIKKSVDYLVSQNMRHYCKAEILQRMKRLQS